MSKETKQAEFNLAVLEMRTAQKEYFRVRTSSNLTLAKRHEANVDRLLKEIVSIPQHQQSMF